MGRANGPSQRYEPDQPAVRTASYRWATIKIGLAVVAVLAVAVYGAVGGGLTAGGDEFDEAAVEAAAIAELNDARQQQGRSPLAHDDTLTERAHSHSTELAGAESLYHGTPACEPGAENVGQTYWNQEVETDQGVETYTTSEELGTAIAQQWLTSETHRESIMSADYSRTGIGVVEQDGAVYATQRLCG